MAECNGTVRTTQRGDSESIVRWRLSREGKKKGKKGKNIKKRAVQGMFRVAVEGFSEISDFVRLNVSQRLRDFNRSPTVKKAQTISLFRFVFLGLSRRESSFSLTSLARVSLNSLNTSLRVFHLYFRKSSLFTVCLLYERERERERERSVYSCINSI